MGVLTYIVFRPIRVLLIALVGVALGFAAFYVYQVNKTFQTVASEMFDPESARSAILDDDDSDGNDAEYLLHDDAGETWEWDIPPIDGFPPSPRLRFPTAFGHPVPDGVFDAYLLLGVDEGGSLADTIILVLEPTGSGRPIMVSLPRDLWVWNMCRNRFTRLNEGLIGCRGVASGSELMAIMVEDYTGIKVDHLARVNFDGFAGVVDALGGVRVCVDHPTRDPNSGLNIANPGCHDADGATALAWVRSRNTESLIDGQWRVTGGSDFVRQRRQQDMLFQLAGRVGGFSSPAELTRTLGAVASSIRLNSNWTFGDALRVGWRHRGVTPASVGRFEIDTRNFTTSAGARVLVPKVRFTEQLGGIFNLPG